MGTEASSRVAAAPLTISMLGPPIIAWEGQSLSIPRRQVRALLYRLAISTEPVPRDVLASLFWPEVTTEAAHTKLSRLLHLLQRALPDPSLLIKQDETITLDPARTWSDTRALGRVLAQPSPTRDNLREAATLYRGPLLDGFALPSAPEFELWLSRERYAWERRFLNLLLTLIDAEERMGNYEQAIYWARRYLQIDELAEAVHRRLILLYAAVGDRKAAARQFEHCVVVLERELGVSPLPETRAAFETVLTGDPAPLAIPPPSRWRVHATMDAPFVGRDDALQVLQQAYMRARTGRGSLVLISGEPGIGKTRLVQEFVALLPRDTLLITVVGSRADENVPYMALVDGLRHILPRIDWQTLPISPTDLARVARLLPDLRECFPGLPIADGFPPGQEQPLLFRALGALFGAFARVCPPVVLCVDDLHWLDVSTRVWIAHWLRDITNSPILIISTYRTGEESTVDTIREIGARHGIATQVVLGGLSPANVHHLVTSVVRDISNARDLSTHLHRTTGGNPFFLLETLRWLLETGVLEQSPLPSTLTDLPLPGTVQEAILRRLAVLPQKAQRVLEAGAVLGPSFDFTLLLDTSGYNDEDVVEAVDTLVAHGLLQEEGCTYRFTHEIVREVVYRRLLYGRRRLLHSRAAKALQRFARDDAAAIAYHLQQADAYEEAVRYWLQAGDRARLLYAYDEAIGHYERALALQRSLGDDEGAARTLMRLGLTHHIAFEFDRASKAYDESFHLWQRATQPAGNLAPATRPLHVDWPHVATLDPGLARDANSGGVIDHLFRGLVEWDPAMNVIPDAARGWDVLSDGRQYVFYLREDCTWSDGHPVTAQDFVVAWRRVLRPGSQSPFVRLLFPIRNAAAYHCGDVNDPEEIGVRALDDLTLLIELSKPCSFFPHVLAHPVARPVPAHIVAEEGERWWHPEVLATNGPFRLITWEWGKQVMLRRCATYRGRWPGNVEEVCLHLAVDPKAKKAKWHLYRDGGLDILWIRWGFPASFLQEIRRNHSNEVISVPNFFVRFVGFDVRRPPFDDVRVRQAFTYGTNRDLLVQNTFGTDLTPAHGGLIPPEMPGHSPRIGLEFDPQRARSLLAEAGYPHGQGFPEVVLQVFPGAIEAGQLLKQLWERVLEVKVVVHIVPWEQYMRHIEEGPRPHLFLAGWVADYPDPDSFLRVSMIREWTGWDNRQYTELVEAAQSSQNQEERMALYRQADEILIKEAPILPLAYSRWTFLVKPSVRSFPLSPLKWWFWKDVILA